MDERERAPIRGLTSALMLEVLTGEDDRLRGINGAWSPSGRKSSSSPSALRGGMWNGDGRAGKGASQILRCLASGRGGEGHKSITGGELCGGGTFSFELQERLSMRKPERMGCESSAMARRFGVGVGKKRGVTHPRDSRARVEPRESPSLGGAAGERRLF